MMKIPDRISLVSRSFRGSIWMRLGMTTGAFFLYGLTFPLLYGISGAEAVAFSALPVALAGWFLGVAGGVLAALIAFILNIGLLIVLGDMMLDLSLLMLDSDRLLGTMVLVIIGGAAGWSHQIHRQNQQALFDRQKIEQTLRASEKRYRVLAENIADVIAFLDRNGIILEQSLAVYKILGFTPEEMVGTSAFAYFHPDELVELGNIFQTLLEKSGNTVHAQLRFRHKDGTWRWLDATGTNLLDEPGIEAIVVNYRDITEQILVKEALQVRVAYDQSLLRLSRQLELAQTYAETMKPVRKEVQTLFGFQSVWVYLDSGNDEFKLMVIAGDISEMAYTEYPTLSIKGDQFLEDVWKSRDIHVVLDAQTDPRTNKDIVSRLGNRTIINIPLVLHENLLGFLGTGTFGKEGVRVLAEEQLDYLRSVASHVAVAISRIELQEALEDRIRFTLLLNRITQTALETTNLSHVAQKLVDQFAYLFDADACYLTLWDEVRQVPIPFAASGLLRNTYSSFTPIPGETTLTGSVLNIQHAIVVEDKFNSPYLSFQIASQLPENSALVLPLIAGEQKLGAVILAYKQARTFLTDETLRGEQAAAQIALAIAKTKWLNEAHQQAEAFATLYETANVLTGKQDLLSLLKSIVENAQNLLKADAGGLYLFDAMQDELEIKVATHPSIPLGVKLKLGEGMAGRVAKTQQPMIVDDYQAWEFRSTKYEGIPVRAAAEVPLLYAGELIGVLAVHEVGENTHRFSETDLRLLSLFAAQAAGAIYNVRLLEAERRRRVEAETLHEAASTLAASLDLNQVLDNLLASLKRVIPYDSASVFLREGEFVRAVAATGLPEPELVLGQRFSLEDNLFQPVIYRTGKPSILEDAQATPGFLKWGNTSYIRGWMGIPLWAHGQIIGVLTIDSRQPGAYTPVEASLTQAFANQAAIAIENARLLEAERRAREEADALRQMTMTFMETLDLNEVLDQIFIHLHRVIPYDTAHIVLLEEDQLRLVPHDGEHSLEDRKRQLEKNLFPRLQETIQSRKPIIVSDTHNDPLWIIYPGFEYIRSWMGVPLIVKDRVVGLLNFDQKEVGYYTEEHALLATTFAGQVAVVIENARLFAETARRQFELTTLLSVSQAVSSSLDAQQVLEQVAQSIAHLLNVKWSALSIYNPSTDSLQTAVEYSIISGFTHTEIGKHYRLSDYPATKQALEMHTPLITRLNDPETELAEKALLQEIDAACALLVPLRAGGRTVGLAELYSEDEQHEFSREDIRLAQALADQIAIAIANSQLYAETRLRLSELEAVNRISKALRIASTMETMFPTLLEETSAILGVQAGAIWVYDPLDHKLHQTVASGWFLDIEEKIRLTGQGIAGKVFLSGETYQSKEFLTDPNTRETVRQKIPMGWGGVCVPLRAGQEVVGAFFISAPSTRQMTEQEIHLLSTIAEIAGGAIHRAQLNTMIQNQLQRLLALRAIDAAISASLDLRLILDLLLEHILSELKVDAACVLLATPYTYTLRFAAGRGFYTTSFQQVILHFGDGLAGQVAVEQAPLTISDLRTLEIYARSRMAQQEGFVFYTGVPLIAKGKIQGVLEIYQRSEFYAPPDWLDFIDALAAQAAIAIDSAQLFADLQRSNTEITLAYDSTLEGWVGMLDLRDKETEGHTQRVTELTLRLAQKLGLKEEQLIHLRRGALLHDIGKLAIPDRILLKTGPLNPDEWDTMRLHPQYAFNMLSRIPFLRQALDIPYCHHEKWDGTGYPRGLKGEQIPLTARLFTVVDVWDALGHDRPYRKAWGAEDIRTYLLENSGTHFDPHIVKIFIELMEEA